MSIEKDFMKVSEQAKILKDLLEKSNYSYTYKELFLKDINTMLIMAVESLCNNNSKTLKKISIYFENILRINV